MGVITVAAVPYLVLQHHIERSGSLAVMTHFAL
jgi:hypothetical protein